VNLRGTDTTGRTGAGGGCWRRNWSNAACPAGTFATATPKRCRRG
jgi:hypothetical protein